MPLQPAFRGFLKASGTVGEGQLGRGEGVGWQGRTNVSTFSSDTLIGNWNEERFDVSRLTQPRPLPSQVSRSLQGGGAAVRKGPYSVAPSSNVIPYLTCSMTTTLRPPTAMPTASHLPASLRCSATAEVSPAHSPAPLEIVSETIYNLHHMLLTHGTYHTTYPD